ncbi:MAG: class I SAM-dependent methyltransferase [Gemmatimonadales bacterium]
MISCCSGFPAAIERQFDARAAADDLRRYRRKGPDITTRLLRDGLRARALRGLTVLDIGAGIGALTFELLDAGIRRAISVDASAASVATAREEAARRQQSHQVEWVHGDFVSLGGSVPGADIVTLDRVVCCYPAVEPLLSEALRHAERCVALSYPRDCWYVRAVVSAQNAARRLAGRAFRTFVHAPRVMEELVRGHGFHLGSRRTTLVWCVDVYVRADAA